MRSAYSYGLLIVEGDLSSPYLPHETLLGACIHAALRPGPHLIRAACIEETALVIKQLGEKLGGGPPGVASGIQPKSKRVFDSETVWVRQLMCISSITERKARSLLEHLGDPPGLQEAPTTSRASAWTIARA